MAQFKHILRFSSGDERRRTLLDLCVAFGVGVCLLLVNILLYLSASVRSVFEGYSRVPATGMLINALFLWLIVLLWITFQRWRASVQRREELEDILSSICPDALVVVNAERKITLCNSSVERIFGLSPEETVNQTTDLLYFDRRKSLSRPREIYEALEKEGFHVGTATGKRKGGGMVPLEIISAELSGGKGGAVLLMRDITERLRFEEERVRLDVRAEQAKKLESFGVLASGIAHDFNNLLMLVHGHTDLMLVNLPEDAPVRENITEIERASVRASELCGHLLSYSGQSNFEMLPVDLSAVVGETGRLLAASVGRGVDVRYELAANLPPIDGDAAQIHQVAMNLIHNAAESLAGKPGDVRVSTSFRECDEAFLREICTVDQLTPGRYVCLEVKDTGCGMSDEIKRRIFDPFFTTKPTGHGMGLAAVVGIVRAHLGGMRVDSRVRKGSCFTVLFRPSAGAPAQGERSV